MLIETRICCHATICIASLLLCSSIVRAEDAERASEPAQEVAETESISSEADEATGESPEQPGDAEPAPPPAPWNSVPTEPAQPVVEVEESAVAPEPAEAGSSSSVVQQPGSEIGPAAALEARSAVGDEPRSWHINILGDATPMFVRHASFDALQTNDSIALAGATVEGGYTFRHQIPLMAQLSYGWTSFGDPLFDDLHPTLEAHSVQLGVLAGYRFWDAMMPYVRVGLTLTWADLTIVAGRDSFEDRAFSPGVYAMAGLELALARRWIRRAFRTDQFTLGVRLEAGYTYLGRFDYGDETDESTLVTHSNSALGTLQLDGATLRVGFLVSF